MYSATHAALVFTVVFFMYALVVKASAFFPGESVAVFCGEGVHLITSVAITAQISISFCSSWLYFPCVDCDDRLLPFGTSPWLQY